MPFVCAHLWSKVALYSCWNCILATSVFSWVKCGVEEWKSFTLVSHNRQWLGAAFIRNIAPLQFGYLLNKSPQTSLCVFHVNLCAHSTLLYFAQTKCRDTTVMKLMLWNWATQPAGFEEHPWPFLRMRRCIEKNKKKTPDTLIVQGHQSCLKFTWAQEFWWQKTRPLLMMHASKQSTNAITTECI